MLIATLAIATAAEAKRVYVIQPGDTPSELSAKFAPSLEELREANPGVDLGMLTVGKQVRNPYPEPAELKRLESEVAGLKDQLARVTGERDAAKREQAATEGLNAGLNLRVAELEPLANQAEVYRDRFWSWVSGLAIAFVLALIDIGWQMRVRRRLDRKIISLQKDVARARIDGVMEVAAPRSQSASALRRANGADTTAHAH